MVKIKKKGSSDHSLWSDMTYGMVNFIFNLPIGMSFTGIIFRHSAYSAHLPTLNKLVVLSSVVHHLVFTLTSSLPFAVGQVQDAGLIFLALMADSVADCVGADSEKLIPTVLCLIAGSTCLVSVIVIAAAQSLQQLAGPPPSFAR